jgi:hypothetical protein
MNFASRIAELQILHHSMGAAFFRKTNQDLKPQVD